MTMLLAEAIGYANRCLEKAKSMGIKVSVAILDEYGQIVQLDRMDGASLMSPDIAAAKAVTALNFRRATAEVAKLEPLILKSIADTVQFKLLPVAGGVPIFNNEELKGAIGVSGASAQQDEELARHAVGV